MYACGDSRCARKIVHMKAERCISVMYLTSCSNVGVCCERVSTVGASRGTSAWSRYIVTSKYNIKEKYPTHDRVYDMGISVRGEGSNVIMFM